MNNRVSGRFAIKTLEFEKVKLRAAEKAATELGKERLLSLPISADFETVKRMHMETAEALRIINAGRRFPFGGLYNISEAVKRARIGGVLNVEELMQVKSSMQAFGALKVFLLTEGDDHPNLAEYGRDLAEIKRSKVESINIPHFIWKQGKGLNNFKVVDIGTVPVLQIRFTQE